MKKVLSILLIVCMFVNISSMFMTVANAATSWNFSGGTLTITGSGDMDNYNSYQPSWKNYWKSIKRIVVEEGVTGIGDNAFSGLNYVESVSLPSTLKTIGYNVFNNLYNLPEIAIPNGVTSIGAQAFMSCDMLKEVILPDTVTQLGYFAFSGCDSLESVELSESLTSIGSSLFKGCTNLQHVTLPKNLLVIDDMFYGCSSLSTIQIPESVTQIVDDAFVDCINLKNIFIPKNVTYISEGAFSGCEKLEDIYVDSNNKNYISIDGNLFDKQKGTLITYAHGKTDKSYVIPDFATGISESAFEVNNKLESIVIPGSISMISYGAFADLENLKFVKLVDGIKIIGSSTFEGCTNLQSINIPNSVERIDSSAFYNCTNLKQIDIPNSVERIDSSAFYNCTSIEGIIIPPSLTFLGDGAFYNCINLQRIYWNTNNYLPLSAKNSVFGAYSLDEAKKTPIEIIFGENIDYVQSMPFIALSDREIILNVPKSVSRFADVRYFPFIKKINYYGSEDEWNNIGYADYLLYETIVYNYKPSYNEDSSDESTKPDTIIPVTSVYMFDKTYTLNVGRWERIYADCSPSNATNQNLKWSSSNSRIATVNDAGIVTGKSEGTVTITAKSSNGKSASCIVNVVSEAAKMDGNYRYSFSNWPDSFGYSNEKDEKGNIIKINYKIPKERYLQLGYTEERAKDSVKTWGGNCFGMSMSSILFYKNILKEENYHIQGLYYEKPSFPIELLFPDQNKKLREMIELLHISQNLNSAIAKPFSLTEVIEELSSNKPIILGMYEKGRKKGHAIVVSGYSQNGSLYDLEFYDCGNYITSITCDVNSRITLTSTNDAPNWKLFEYYCYDDLYNIYLDILKNGKDSISLFSNNNTDSYTQIITPANDMSIFNSQGKKMTIQDGEICSDIDNIKLIPSSYLSEESTYTIILPTDTYTIVGSGDEVITTSFADDYMSASISAKSCTPITISSDLKEISVDTAADEEYNITYTTYDNIFDEMNLSGTATGTVTSKLNDTDITIAGIDTLTASASVSDSVGSANSDSLSNSDEITVKCEETNGGATIQILNADAELTGKTSLPERLTVDTPAYDLVSGTYTEGQVLNFTKDDETIIYYTTDGNIPSADNGIIYSLPIDINKSMTVKAISTKYGYFDSEIVELNYTLPEVDMPQANVESGEYDEVITVELSTNDYEDTIYYTLDGSSPLENGILYTVPISISEDTYLQACTLRNGCISEISEYEYTVSPTYPFYFSNSLTNQDGEIITPDNIADVTKVKMSLSKLHAGDHTGMFLIAFYSADNRLLYVNYKSATISEDIDEVEIDIAGDVSSACKIKAFAWKDLSSIQPICEALEENIIIE